MGYQIRSQAPARRDSFPVAGKDGPLMLVDAGPVTLTKVRPRADKVGKRTPRKRMRARHRRYANAGGTLSFREWLRDQESKKAQES